MEKIIMICLILFNVVSCKNWLDVNTSPNDPSNATLEQVYPSAVTSTVSVVGGGYAILGGIWSQYFTQNPSSNQYKNIDAYNLISSDFNRQYTELYSGALNDFSFVRNQATETQNWSYYLMATVVESYTWQVLVDLYDQIPFSEANRGDLTLTGGSVDALSPHYEQGQNIYDSLILRIDVALSKNLGQTGSGGILTSKDPLNSDFIFGTNLALSFEERMTLWRQFANTLKLKIYLRESYARPDVTQAGIQAMVNDSNFAGFLIIDAAFTQFKDETNKSNPFYESNIRQLNTSDNLKASTTMLDSFLVPHDDTLRMKHLYSPVGGNYVGLTQGDFTSSVQGASLSGFIQTPTDPVYLISAAESYFLQAEAVLKGYMQGDDQSLYSSGVLAAFAQWREDGTSYLATQAVYPSTGTMEDKLKAIITQKWASMAGTHGLEAFFEYNRTHYPDFLVYSAHGVTPNQMFPKRLILPETEKERNKNAPTDNAPIYQKIWWDAKP